MRIDLEFNSLAELDEFVAHYVKTKALQTTAAVAPAPKEVKVETPKETKTEPKAPKEPAPKEAKAEPKAGKSEDDAKTIDYTDDVAPRVLKLAEKKGRDAAVAVLSQFNVTKAPQLKPDQYAAFIEAVDAKLAED